MERRQFLELASLTSGALMLNGCEALVQENPQGLEKFNLIIDPNVGFEIQTSTQNYGRTLFGESAKNVRKSLDFESSQTENLLLDYDISRNYDNLQGPLLELKKETTKRFEKLQKNFVFESNIHIIDSGLITSSPNGRILSPNGWDVGGSVGNYYVRVSLEKHYIGGCIGRDVWHAGILINNNANPKPKKLSFDLHVASWKQNRDVCVGGYESKTGWCKKICAVDTWRSIRDIVYGVLIAYVSYSVAIAIAEFVATISLPIVLFA